jgi:hypothetical protein
MSSFDSLPPDQRAVLQLVLGQGRTYEDLASMLGIEPVAVRARAVGAAEALGPDAGRLAPERRAEIVDFLLGQGTAGQRQATREYLGASAGGRAWARAVSGELRPLNLGELPEIPDEAEAPPEAPAETAVSPEEPSSGTAPAPRPRAARARRREPEPALQEPAARAPARERPSSSRIGGALLLAGIGIAVAVVLIIVIGGGGGNDSGSTQTATGTASSTTQTSTTAPRPEAQVNLRGPGKALGVAQIVSQQGQRAMALVAQGLPASPQGYAVWLYNSRTDLVRLGFTQAVGKDGKLSALSPLPKNASHFRELVISRETAKQPREPTRVLLRGPLKLS